MSTAKKIGRIKTTLDVDMYLQVCDYNVYMENSDEGEKVYYGVKIALHLLHPESRETVDVIRQNKLIDSEKISFKDDETKLATFERYFKDKALEVYKNAFVENELACCKSCGEPEGLHEIESRVVYAKCKCDLKAFLSQEKCKK